jgi:hypothetical protein
MSPLSQKELQAQTRPSLPMHPDKKWVVVTLSVCFLWGPRLVCRCRESPETALCAERHERPPHMGHHPYEG